MCSDTPRFSYGVPESTVYHGVPVPSRVVHAVPGRCSGLGGTGVGYTGWVPGRGNTGSLPTSGKRSPDSEAGPGSPYRGLEWVVRVQRPPAVPDTTPAGPGRSPAVPSLYLALLPASWPIGRDSTSFLRNLVKTTKCRRKVSKRPPIVPNSQNGVQKSPLEILRFTFCPAFSHKELMGHFEPTAGFIVKMTKCRQCAHP